MGSAVRERDLQARVVNYARAKGAIARKLDFGMGWPDFMFIYDSKLLFVEFKTEVGRVSPLQAYVHSQLGNQGFVVCTVRDPFVGLHLIDALLGSPTQASLMVDCVVITEGT